LKLQLTMNNRLQGIHSARDRNDNLEQVFHSVLMAFHSFQVSLVDFQDFPADFPQDSHNFSQHYNQFSKLHKPLL
jgi:hypothetical protein